MSRDKQQVELPGMVFKREPDSAIDFLEQFHLGGPWHLVAIHPDRGQLEATTFLQSERYEMRRWIDERNGKKNLYFHVNRLRPNDQNIKAKKENIDQIPYLHVDIDHDDALEAIKNFPRKPTVTIWSGNGVHAYWKLSTATDDQERVERCNRALEQSLRGDNCHNVDRILRLPFTENLPNKKKRQKGREISSSYIIEELTDWERIYNIDDFDEIDPSIKSKTTVNTTVSIPSITTIEDLPEKVSEYTRQLIIHGDDPEHPRNSKEPTYASRSEPLFRVSCDLVRAGCNEEFICGILINPEYAISESVREKKDALGYARKQVLSAIQATSDKWSHVTKAGQPKASYENAIIALHKLNLRFEYDVFRNRLIANGLTIQEFQGELTDNVCVVIRKIVLEQFNFDPGKEHIRDAIHTLCLENTFHPIKDYLSSVHWDGVPRLDTMLIDYFEAANTPLNKAIGRLMMVAAVRRIMSPGAKFDSIVVLEGYQGSGKSTALRILAGNENFSDQDILSLDTKSQIEVMEGVWIFEICELEGMRRNEVNKIKAFASRVDDKARAAYARFSERRPRQSVFVGTTNDDQYLKDETGNRRFLPVRTGQIDLEALAHDRDQLWAEAAVYEARGESITLHESLWEAAAKEQDLRMENDSWEDILRDVRGTIHHGFYRISSSEILTDVLEIPKERQQRHHSTRVGQLMRKIGWTGPKSMVIGSQRVKGYERPAERDDEPI